MHDGVGELFEGFEWFVGDGLVGEQPKALGGQEFGRVRWQEAKVKTFG